MECSRDTTQQQHQPKPILILMGVSGSGKSTIGKLLHKQMGIPFLDGDDLHPPENVEKMRSGVPLNDEDRKGWLNAIAEFISERTKFPEATTIACSALKSSYREILQKPAPERVAFVFLKGDRALLDRRLVKRTKEENHFMSKDLLDSQLGTLENPCEKDVFVVQIQDSPEVIASKIIDYFRLEC